MVGVTDAHCLCNGLGFERELLASGDCTEDEKHVRVLGECRTLSWRHGDVEETVSG
jgi:hypothetical protein